MRFAGVLLVSAMLVGCGSKPDRSASVTDAKQVAQTCITKAVTELDRRDAPIKETVAKVKDRCSIELMLPGAITSMDDKSSAETRAHGPLTTGDEQILQEVTRQRAAGSKAKEV